MTNDEIRELIRILQETGIAELEVQRGDDRVWICGSRASTQEPAISPILPMTLDSSEQSTLAHSGAAAAGPQLVSAPAPVVSMDEQSNDQTVTSPIVGTYYDAPAPNSPPFVKVGDQVEPKQVLCIIESMKLMNEIEAEISGTLISKLVENGRPVEYGETLFTIRPN